MRTLILVIAALIGVSPALADDGRSEGMHRYTFSVAQKIGRDLFDHSPVAKKLGLTADHVELLGELPFPPETCLVEVTTATGRIFQFKFQHNSTTGIGTLDPW